MVGDFMASLSFRCDDTRPILEGDLEDTADLLRG